MPEWGSSGSVRGDTSNGVPYRDRSLTRYRLKATDEARPVFQPFHRNDPICLVPLDGQDL